MSELRKPLNRHGFVHRLLERMVAFWNGGVGGGAKPRDETVRLSVVEDMESDLEQEPRPTKTPRGFALWYDLPTLGAVLDAQRRAPSGERDVGRRRRRAQLEREHVGGNGDVKRAGGVLAMAIGARAWASVEILRGPEATPMKKGLFFTCESAISIERVNLR